MPTILMFGVPYTGHVNPLYPVLRRLRAEGAEIIVVNDESYREPLEEAGVRFRPYPSGARYDRLVKGVQPTSMPGLARDLMALANELLRFTISVIDEVRPDCVLHDSIACWAMLALRRRPMPAMTLVTTFVFSLELSDRNVSGRARLRILGQLLAVLPGILLQRLTTRIRHGMRPLAIFETFMALEERNIVFTSEEFQPASERFRERCEFVGPTGWKREQPVDFPYEQLDADRPIVYISFGTLMEATDLLHECFEAFGDAGAQFVLSLGGRDTSDSFGPVPENFIVREYVPQVELLSRVSAFLTHGGMNSVHESLLAGVPMLVVPLQEEEAVVARRVVDSGAGVAVQLHPPYGRAGASELRNALEKLLDDERFARRAREIGDGLRAAGGEERAVRVIMECT